VIKDRDSATGQIVPKFADFEKWMDEFGEVWLNSNKAVDALLTERGLTKAWFYQNLHKHGLRGRWEEYGKSKALSLQENYHSIIDDAKRAFEDKTLNPNALKIQLEATKTYQGQLDSRFRDREVKHTVDVQVSHRQIMTEGRARLEKKNQFIEAEYEVVDDKPDQ